MRPGERKSLRRHARIVIMDSDQECVGFLRKELGKLGYKAEAVKQTKILLRMIRNDFIDILILAVDAWGGAFDLIPVIKKMNRSLPIIATSSDGSLETAGKVREQGVLFYAIKPLDMQEIESVLKNALARAPIQQKPITIMKQAEVKNELEKDIMDMDEASRILKITRNTLTRLARQGSIPACRIANRWYFIKNQLYEWMRIQAAGNQSDYSKMILETMDEGVAVVDKRLKIISCNSAYLKALDVRLDRVIGEPCYRVSHRSVTPCDEPMCPVRKAFKTQQPVKVLHVNYDNEGRERYCDIVALPIKDTRGRVQNVLEIIRDNTEIYSLNRHLNSVMRFFARDSKAALGTVMMNISALADETLSAAIEGSKRDEMLASSLCNLKLMQDRIRNYIVSYQAENGRLQCKRRMVDIIDEIVAPVISETIPFLRKKAISIDTVAEKLQPACCDVDLMKVALTNLITSMVKNMMHGSGIQCSVKADNELSIAVSSICSCPSVDRYWTLPDDILDVEAKEISDAALGLHIARKIAEVHGGMLNIKRGKSVFDRHFSLDECQSVGRNNHSEEFGRAEFVEFRLRIPQVEVHWEHGGDR